MANDTILVFKIQSKWLVNFSEKLRINRLTLLCEI